jgi:hypothetical protein
MRIRRPPQASIRAALNEHIHFDRPAPIWNVKQQSHLGLAQTTPSDAEGGEKITLAG